MLTAAVQRVSLVLGAIELRELTGKVRGDAQRRVLDRMGIAYRARPDGSLAVLRACAEAALGAPAGGATIPATREPEMQF
jgi:2-methylcitrate dehydratase PrpD